ncbi:glycosyltransferase [uncultured Tateyamaria sp.]|uniref:glycosyltransferase n=1 Tax=uncultured Tateyamaria sp. TaxID=455651 RepID=UPI0026333A9B|nr:glycosyltransferase [uncultured Tateyamaria sp.]
MIDAPYTLFTRIPLYADADGAVHADDLWAKDLACHLTYIQDFRICCPLLPMAACPDNAVVVTGLSQAQVIPVARDRGWLSVLRNLVPNFLQVRRAVKHSRIVHSGGAGWAFPLSYYVLLLRPFLTFQWIMVIESSFWMKPDRGPVSLRQRLSHMLHSRLVRACVRAADAHIFTQSWYRDLFLPPEVPAHVAPAVWIDAEDILDTEAHAARQPKRSDGPARLIFPARLVPEKGVETVLKAIEAFERRHEGQDIPAPLLQVDLMGAGALAAMCRNFADQPRRAVQVRFLEQVAYGPPFFELIGEYEALLVANQQPEQPRIIFDAFSQALPVIATRTPGIETCLEQDRTGWLFDVDDSAALADLFERAIAQPQVLADMGAWACDAVSTWTHARMHQNREVFLKTRLNLAAQENC